MSENNDYINIAPSSVRKPYGRGRVDIKLSVTNHTHQLLADLGVITREVGTDQAPVAKKGGFGSAFIEFSVEFLLYLLLKDDTRRERVVEYVAGALFDLLDSNPENVKAFNLNAQRLIVALESRSEKRIAVERDL